MCRCRFPAIEIERVRLQTIIDTGRLAPRSSWAPHGFVVHDPPRELAAKRIREADRYRFRASAGLCRCGSLRDGAGLLCSTCRPARGSSRAKRTAADRGAGLCVSGCGAPAADGRLHCRRHLDQRAALARAWKARRSA